MTLWLAGGAPAAARPYPHIFNTNEFVSNNFVAGKGVIVNWVDMLKRWRNGAPCETNICTSRGWGLLIAQVKSAGNPRAELDAANALLNAHPYVYDMANWGVEDYWATAFQFLKKSGDCEDYAIAKYMLLKAAGIPVEDMRVVQAKLPNAGGIGHAILVVYLANGAWILDNRFPQVMNEALSRLEYQPIQSMNEQFWWYHRPVD